MKTLLWTAVLIGSLFFTTSGQALPRYWDTYGHRVFVFDPRYHEWAAYNEYGKRVNYGKASGGKSYCPDLGRSCRTVVGTFNIFSMKGADCRSSRFPRPNGGAYMPYCMFFHPKGYAIHGAPDVPDEHVSHGCIRVSIDDAEWLRHDFAGIGTKVVVLPY